MGPGGAALAGFGPRFAAGVWEVRGFARRGCSALTGNTVLDPAAREGFVADYSSLARKELVARYFRGP